MSEPQLDAAPDPPVADTPATPAAATPTTAADSLSPTRLKQLRQAGLAMKDVIKLGRRGAAPGLTSQIQRRWNSSEVGRRRTCAARADAELQSVHHHLLLQTVPHKYVALPGPPPIGRWPGCAARASSPPT